MKKQIIAAVLALGLLIPFCASTSLATEIAVIDAAKIFADSNPAKAGEAHLKQVQDILQKGMNDLQAMYKGQENTPAAQQDIAQAYNALNQQMAIERQAVQNVLNALLVESVKEWRAKNSKYDVVLNSQIILDYTSKADVTSAVLKIYNTKKTQFADLPQITINKPADAPAAGN